MLMRTDPFRELDRLTQQVFGSNGTLGRPSAMPMDTWREGDTFHVEFDLPGVKRTGSTWTSNATSSPSRPSARTGPATPS